MSKQKLLLIGSIVGIHLFVFFFNFREEAPPPSPKKSLLVHTYVPPPPKPKAPVTKSSPSPSRPSPSTSKQSLLKKTLSNIETPPPPSATLPLPKKIQSLQIDHADKKEETDYFISLAHALKEALELPEQGEVKLELTVSCMGRVLKLRILQAVSEKNRRYLELNLPQMSLPPFSEELKNESAHTFTLTFCNAS
ncbi:MAG: hypothetical protein KDK64_07480 [Chlamydiia bacterium]|nr:hypothetical protein [Chlamydiia bacterium]